MAGLSKTSRIHPQMMIRALHQPFVRPLCQALGSDVRTMNRRVTRAPVPPCRRAKAQGPQLQNLPDRQDVGGFAQDHGGGLAQGAGDPTENAQHRYQPRHRPMLRAVFTETEYLTGLTRVAVAVTTVRPLNEGRVDLSGGGRGVQPLLRCPAVVAVAPVCQRPAGAQSPPPAPSPSGVYPLGRRPSPAQAPVSPWGALPAQAAAPGSCAGRRRSAVPLHRASARPSLPTLARVLGPSGL